MTSIETRIQTVLTNARKCPKLIRNRQSSKDADSFDILGKAFTESGAPVTVQ